MNPQQLLHHSLLLANLVLCRITKTSLGPLPRALLLSVLSFKLFLYTHMASSSTSEARTTALEALTTTSEAPTTTSEVPITTEAASNTLQHQPGHAPCDYAKIPQRL